MSCPSARLLILLNPSDASLAASCPHDQAVPWPTAPVGRMSEVARAAQEEAGRVVRRLADSDWWTVGELNLARLLADILVREIGEQVRALLQAEALLEGNRPTELLLPVPLKPAHYQADGMIAEALRLAALRRAIPLRRVGGPVRRAQAAAAESLRGAALSLLASRPVRQALRDPRPRSLRGPLGPETSRRTLLVGPSSGAELQAHRPVSSALREQGWRVVPFDIPFYYTRPEWRSDTLPEGVVPLGACGGMPAYVEAARASDELLLRLDDPSLRAAHRSAFEVLGVDLLDSSYLRARFQRLSGWDARLGVALYHATRRLCEAVEPTVLLSVKGEGPQGRAPMTAAQDLGIPVVFAPHGVHADDPRWDHVPADLVLADSAAFAEIVTRRSGTPARAIGTPKYDAFLQARDSAVVARTRADLLPQSPPSPVGEGQGGEDLRDGHGAEGSLWLCYACTDRPDRDRETIAALASWSSSAVRPSSLAVTRHPSPAVLVVKTHPRRSQPELVASFSQAAGPRGFVVTTGDTMEVLWACDVVVTGASTAAIEAMAAGRPVLYVGSLDEDVHGYAREGIALHAATPAEVGERLSEVLQDEGPTAERIARGRDYAARKLGLLDGHATDRAVAEITGLLPAS